MKHRIIKKHLFVIILITTLTGCHFPTPNPTSIKIINLQDDQTIPIEQEIRIISQVKASQGLESISLFIDGKLHGSITPSDGNQTEYIAEHTFYPEHTGECVIKLVAKDKKGNFIDSNHVTLNIVSQSSEIAENQQLTLTPTPEQISQVSTVQTDCTNKAAIIQEFTNPTDTYLPTGTSFTKTWRIQNTGTCDWIGYEITHTNGDLMGIGSPQALPLVNSGSTADVVLELKAPSSPGTYNSTWRIRNDLGMIFGPELSLTVMVAEPPTATQKPVLTSTATATQTATQISTETTEPIGVYHVKDQFTIPAHNSAAGSVTCPADSVVVSGGFQTKGEPRIWRSRKKGNGWEAHAQNPSGSPETITVYASCLRLSNATTTQESFQNNANPNTITTLEKACPSGSVVTGGGWSISPSSQIQIIYSGKSANGWQIYIHSAGGVTPLIDVYTICLSGFAGTTSQIQSNVLDVASNGVGGVSKVCPSDQFALGGGFATNAGVQVYISSQYGNGWQNYVWNQTSSPKTLQTFITCLQE